jgi:Protein of unknown function (DUF3500)
MKQLLLLLLLPALGVAQDTKMATAFIHSLSQDQQAVSVFKFTDSNRKTWNYLPASMAARNGVAIKDLSEKQKKLLNNVLQNYLSKEGFKRVKDIMSFEWLLKELEPTNANRIPDNYFVAFYGTPATDSVWGWKFSGHHLALNFTVVDGVLAFAPLFFGSNPGIVLAGPLKGTQLLKTEEELGFQLLGSLSAAQLQKAVFQETSPYEIISDSAKLVIPPAPAGIVANELSASQQNILHQAVLAYLMAMPVRISKARMARVSTEELSELRFAWAGSKLPGAGHYYRIQGKTFLIEFDNTQNNANHVHSVWRDFDGDFGEDLLMNHYHQTPHHHN